MFLISFRRLCTDLIRKSPTHDSTTPSKCFQCDWPELTKYQYLQWKINTTFKNINILHRNIHHWRRTCGQTSFAICGSTMPWPCHPLSGQSFEISQLGPIKNAWSKKMCAPLRWNAQKKRKPVLRWRLIKPKRQKHKVFDRFSEIMYGFNKKVARAQFLDIFQKVAS